MKIKEFKDLCKKEFNVNRFSVPSEYKLMTEAFNIPARTFQNWIAKKNIRPWFDTMVDMYFKIKDLDNKLKSLKDEKEELEKLLIEFNDRLSKLKNR